MEQETHQTPLEEDPYYLITLYHIKSQAPNLTEQQQQFLLNEMMDFVNKKKTIDKIIPFFIMNLGTDKIVMEINKSIEDGENESLRNTEKLKQQSLRTGRKVIQNWTEEEDRRLLYAIHKYGQGDWNVIADFCANGRNRSQCAQRWNRVLDPRISKDPWTEAEEQRLKELVDEHGEKSWKIIADILGNRTDIQCRYHYKNVMQKVKDKKKPTTTRIDYGSDDGLPMTRKSYALQQQLQKQQQEEREQNQQNQPVQQVQAPQQQQQPQLISIQSMQVQPIRQVPMQSMSSIPQTQPFGGQQFYSPYAAQASAQMMVMPPAPPAIPQTVPQPIQTPIVQPAQTISQQQNDASAGANASISQNNNNNSSYSVPFILKDLLSNPLAADPKPMEPEMSWLTTVEQKAPPKVIDEY